MIARTTFEKAGPAGIGVVFGLLLAVLFGLSLPASAQGRGAATYASPDDAAKALYDAAKKGDIAAVAAALGAGALDWVNSGDATADREAAQKFAAAYEERRAFEKRADGMVVLVTGKDEFPFPFPIVAAGDRWRFDIEAGKEELLNRRIGRNELAAVQVLLAIADAQFEYASEPRDAGGAPQYAQRFDSTPGKRDGLYWETRDGEKPSPLGPLVAQAQRDGYMAEGRRLAPVPYYGYQFRILAAQGPQAPGGAHAYVVNGRMIGGFAVVAWPARYGNSGIMTFLISHDGVVYEKDLGPNSASIAARLNAFNPDPSWRKH